jgi:hypothetical protein
VLTKNVERIDPIGQRTQDCRKHQGKNQVQGDIGEVPTQYQKDKDSYK